MSTTYYVKFLRLVSPQVATDLGIPAEAPTFISPDIDTVQCCARCKVSYGPLTYQTGVVTTAQHYHATSGGIYFHAMDDPGLVAECAERLGWTAFIEPIGKTQIWSRYHGRSQAIRITRITATCMYAHAAMYISAAHERWRCSRHMGHSLDEGLLVTLSSYPLLDSRCFEMLSPVCDTAGLQKQKRAPFTFRIRDGAVFFTQRPLP